jgi:hypothetical protein
MRDTKNPVVDSRRKMHRVRRKNLLQSDAILTGRIDYREFIKAGHYTWSPLLPNYNYANWTRVEMRRIQFRALTILQLA